MGKFMIECPSCGRYAEASIGIFGIGKTKSINCSCGYVISVQTAKMTSVTCVHCGNDVVYDQSKGASAACPVCHEKINGNVKVPSLWFCGLNQVPSPWF